MEYYAHTTDDRKQTVREHLENVAEAARDNSVELTKDIAYFIGLAHDIGKYSLAFQRRLSGSSERFEHSSCGAIEAGKLNTNISAENRLFLLYMIQYCIAGHHTGLPDGGSDVDLADADTTLHSRLKREKNYIGDADYSAYSQQIDLVFPEVIRFTEEFKKVNSKTELVEKYVFFTRYLFSCLTDADFIDTEHFCSPEIERGCDADFSEAEKSVDECLSGFVHDTPLKLARSRLQEQAVSRSSDDSAVSILNMPTGSGKTLCSIKIALKKLREHGKKRIIYVIPYTSIIEQTAETFEKLFGKYADILQHHSNYCFEDMGENDLTADKLKRSAENWDAPIIITTCVQFFQSLYHYRSSGLRKLHNYADSIIIFDEVHMLPVEMLQPCLRGIGFVTKYLNSEAVFLSATMPDYTPLFEKFSINAPLCELIRDKSDFSYFSKCRYIDLGTTTIESIAERAMGYGSSLIIVNSRRTAREMYNILGGKKYHLSTYMTPSDRSAAIKAIRSDLAKGEKITVVSTSLVEAGVDLDFETVFRQLAGLDSILQSGGRCNREGKRECGDVFIFATDEKPHGDLQIRASAMRELLQNYDDISSQECIREYYSRIFNYSKEAIERNSIANITHSLDSIPFRTYSEKFKFIQDDTVGVVINNNTETEELLALVFSSKKTALRKLQKYTVSLKLHGEYDKALSIGLIRDVGNGVYVLTNNDNYRSDTGLDIDHQSDYLF